MTAIVLNEHNINLVNSLRNAAMKSSADFNVVKFFAEFEYASARLALFATSGVPELATLAGRVAENLFRQPVERLQPAAQQAPARAQAEPLFVKPLVPSPSRYISAKELMNGLAVDAAGFRSLLFVLQLENTSCTADLVALLPRFQKLLAARVGATAATAVVDQVSRVL